MANICYGRLLLTPCEKHKRAPLFEHQGALDVFAAEFKGKIRCYDFDVVYTCAEFVEIDCGFRWMPPFKALAALSRKHRLSLRCTYNEPGSCFMGAWRAVDGKVRLDKSIDY